MKASLLMLFLTLSFAGFSKELSVYSLPMTCAELIPDQEPFIAFFEATARGSVLKDKALSKRIFRILSLREKLNATGDKAREQNPVDLLIRKTLCFYREQKEPIKPVPFNDDKYLSFIKSSMNELEGKVKDAVFDAEYIRAAKKQYEAKLSENESLVDQLRVQANQEATQEFDKMSREAKKKVNH